MSRLATAARVLGDVWSHPANRGRQPHALARFLGWQAWHRLTRQPLHARVFGGARLVVHPGDHSAVSALYAELPDYAEMSFLKRLLRPGDAFLDVGANVGLYTVFASTLVGETGKIFAVEPVADARWRLMENIAANRLQNVVVFPFVVGDVAGWSRVTSDAGTMNYVTEFVAGEEAPPGDAWVRAESLDSLLTSETPIAAKVDVEGFELHVLRGATALLKAHRPAAWLIEWNECARRYGATQRDLWQLVTSTGGRIGRYSVEGNEVVSLHLDHEWPANVVIVMEDGFVRDRLRSR